MDRDESEDALRCASEEQNRIMALWECKGGTMLLVEQFYVFNGRRLRYGGSEDKALEEPLLMTMNGISNIR